MLDRAWPRLTSLCKCEQLMDATLAAITPSTPCCSLYGYVWNPSTCARDFNIHSNGAPRDGYHRQRLHQWPLQGLGWGISFRSLCLPASLLLFLNPGGKGLVIDPGHLRKLAGRHPAFGKLLQQRFASLPRGSHPAQHIGFKQFIMIMHKCRSLVPTTLMTPLSSNGAGGDAYRLVTTF